MKLVAVSGPLLGSTFVVDADEFTIGREPGNSLWLEDPAVSRRHCCITSSNGESRIRDLSSRNGTVVNRVKLSESPLSAGDEIQIGHSVFLVAPAEAGAPVPGGVEVLETISSKVRQGDSIFLRGDLESKTRTERELSLLLQLSTTAAACATRAQLEDALKLMLPQLIRCEAVTVRILDSAAPADIAEQRAASEGSTILHESRLLVIPVCARQRPVMLMRLEGTFRDHHLQLAAAAGSIASLALATVLQMEALEEENRSLRVETDVSCGIVCNSPRMREVMRLVARVAGSDTTALVLGESGTGKELVARAIHRNSARSDAPFVAINCAALNEHLLESELFGHEKGAFTGAVTPKRGRIETAEGGTLFLDEIGELAPGLQAKLLRVLQEREFERVGGLRTLRADVRVIAATNRNLAEAIRVGTFRQDLYYRLNVVAVELPPLRERREDIIPLASLFLERFAQRAGRVAPGMSPEAKAYLMRYEWPGNVRELENAIERAVVLGSGDAIGPEDLPEGVVDSGSVAAAGSGYHDAVREAKRRILLGAIEQAAGNHSRAARLLGLNPTYLSRLMRNLDCGRE